MHPPKKTRAAASRESTPEMHVSDEVREAATVLDALKGSQVPPLQPQNDSSLLDKMVSHPIITNSINYVLEKTISSANINAIARKHPLQEEEQQVCSERIRKRPKLPTMQKPIGLRQQATLQSAVENTQKSLQNIKDLSALNINIESRKKLTMLIKFLKLGNNQLSERIERLIDNVDKHRSKLEPTKSQPNDINAITSDIILTIKKVVNVVSKVPAQSFSESARNKIREALLKLPTNLSNNELHFLTGDDLTSIVSSSSSSEDEEEDEGDQDKEEVNDEGSNSDYEDSKESLDPIPTIRVTNKRLFQKIRRPSITRRLLNSILEYRQVKKGKSQLKMKKWFREKIKDQVMNDSNGKVLILAQESLDMINKIIRTCSESLDRAENWNIERQLTHQKELSNKLMDIEKPNDTHTGANRESTPEIITVKEVSSNL